MAWEFCGVSHWLLQLSPLSVEFGLPRPSHCGQGTPFYLRKLKHQDMAFMMALTGRLHPVTDRLWEWKSSTAERTFSQVTQPFLSTYLGSRQ